MRAAGAAVVVVVAAGSLAALVSACSPGENADAGSGDPPQGIVARDGGLFVPRDAGRVNDAGPQAPALCPPDDGLEDNDERASASPLTSGQELEATFCGGDDDWFSLEAQTGCQVEARVRFDPRGGDLDLSLYGPDGTLVGASNTAGASEIVSVSASGPGAYSARVRGGQSVKTTYRVRLTATCASELSCPADDAFEENDAEDAARGVSQGSPAIGIVCPDDSDWFSFQTPAGCAAVAELDFVHSAEGDLDLRFQRPDGSEGGRSLSVSDDERAVEGGSADGPLLLRVYGVGADTNTYRLTVNRVCSEDLACPADDPFEPNDERTESVRLYPPTEIPATACASDEDWYRVTVSSGCTLELAVDFSHAEGDLDVELRDSSDAILASSRTSTDDEELSFTATSFTTAYARVFVFQGGGTPRYRLSLVESCGDAGP